MADQLNDRRSFPRIAVQARMRISNNFIGVIEGYSRDISNTGIFIQTTPLPPVSRGTYIRLNMLDSANPEILFNARVVRITQNGMALALTDYELHGRRFTIDELRRQWAMTRADIKDFKSRA